MNPQDMDGPSIRSALEKYFSSGFELVFGQNSQWAFKAPSEEATWDLLLSDASAINALAQLAQKLKQSSLPLFWEGCKRAFNILPAHQNEPQLPGTLDSPIPGIFSITPRSLNIRVKTKEEAILLLWRQSDRLIESAKRLGVWDAQIFWDGCTKPLRLLTSFSPHIGLEELRSYFPTLFTEGSISFLESGQELLVTCSSESLFFECAECRGLLFLAFRNIKRVTVTNGSKCRSFPLR